MTVTSRNAACVGEERGNEVRLPVGEASVECSGELLAVLRQSPDNRRYELYNKTLRKNGLFLETIKRQGF